MGGDKQECKQPEPTDLFGILDMFKPGMEFLHKEPEAISYPAPLSAGL